MKALQILVVEDDSLIAMLLVETLAEIGHGVCSVEATESGAVAAALRCQPDLIIVDAQLREGSGVAAVDEILSTGFVPHLFISGDIKKSPGAGAGCSGDREAISRAGSDPSHSSGVIPNPGSRDSGQGISESASV